MAGNIEQSQRKDIKINYWNLDKGRTNNSTLRPYHSLHQATNNLSRDGVCHLTDGCQSSSLPCLMCEVKVIGSRLPRDPPHHATGC